MPLLTGDYTFRLWCAGLHTPGLCKLVAGGHAMEGDPDSTEPVTSGPWRLQKGDRLGMELGFVHVAHGEQVRMHLGMRTYFFSLCLCVCVCVCVGGDIFYFSST